MSAVFGVTNAKYSSSPGGEDYISPPAAQAGNQMTAVDSNAMTANKHVVYIRPAGRTTPSKPADQYNPSNHSKVFQGIPDGGFLFGRHLKLGSALWRWQVIVYSHI